MGLATDLGYQHGQRNGFHRGIAWSFATRPGAWLGKWLVPYADKVVVRLTGGKATASDWLAALPPLWVTTIGAKSGQQRRHALYGIPIHHDLALIGSNFGQEKNPAWVYNLQANPEATVEYQGNSVRARARPATKVEQSEIWETASQIYLGYPKYRDRASHRTIQVFVLEPV